MNVNERDAWTQPDVENVAPGVHRVPLPLPGDGLRAVNVYILRDGNGVALVDGGWAIAESWSRLETALASLSCDFDSINRILVTHIHRDHLELACELGRLFGSRVELGAGERQSLDSLVQPDEVDESSPSLRTCLISAGADVLIDYLDEYNAAEPDVAWRMPDVWLSDREFVALTNRRLEVIATPGHTRGHVVFVDHDSGLLFAGDHILPHITPSIGFEAVPSESALGDYVASLATVRALPDFRLLPAHGPVQPTSHDRIDQLLTHHEVRLSRMFEAVRAGAETAFQVAEVVPWTRRDYLFSSLDHFNQVLAVNETIAHLDELVRRERLDVDGEAVRRYRS